MKAHKDLRTAILEGMTPDQRKELSGLITQLAENARKYGENQNDMEALQKANYAYHELNLKGLPVKF